MTNRDNNFNLLRLALAFLVIVSHSPELLDGNRAREPLTRLFGTYSFGEFAVNSFFILSGYLISASWLAAPYWPVFLRKRLLRIVPGFAAAAGISFLIVGPLSSPTFWTHFHPLRFFGQLPFLIFDLTGFSGNRYDKVNGALWTIHYEFVCYLLAGMLGFRKMLKRPRIMGMLFLASLLAYLAYLWAQDHAILPDSGLAKAAWLRIGHYIRFSSFFLAGASFRLWHDRLKVGPVPVVFACTACALLMFNRYTAPLAMALPWTYLIFAMAYADARPARVFRQIDLSYGLYLYAWPIQQLLIQYKLAGRPWVLVVLTTLLGLSAACASWFLIEKPALRLKPGLTSGKQAMVADTP